MKPIIIYVLTKFGLVTPDQLIQYRRHAFVIILIVASILTPPDFFSQILIGVPVYILYEISKNYNLNKYLILIKKAS